MRVLLTENVPTFALSLEPSEALLLALLLQYLLIYVLVF